MNNTYFETFAQAINGAIQAADKAKALLSRPTEVWSMVQGRALFYGQARTGAFAIARLRGRPTKKFFHVTIYRLDRGRYELVTYVL
jgi:hypothetical protein